MNSPWGRFREAFAVLTGGVLYAGLNWIPVLGPLAVGALVGFYGTKSVKRGFDLGVCSGVLGSLAVALILFRTGVFEGSGTQAILLLLFGWIMFVWQLVGILLCGIGGAGGVGLKSIKAALTSLFDGHINWGADKSVVYRICPKCNEGTPDKNGVCVRCGSAIA